MPPSLPCDHKNLFHQDDPSGGQIFVCDKHIYTYIHTLSVFTITQTQHLLTGGPWIPLKPGEPGSPCSPFRPGKPELPVAPGDPGSPGNPGVPPPRQAQSPGSPGGQRKQDKREERRTRGRWKQSVNKGRSGERRDEERLSSVETLHQTLKGKQHGWVKQ